MTSTARRDPPFEKKKSSFTLKHTTVISISLIGFLSRIARGAAYTAHTAPTLVIGEFTQRHQNIKGSFIFELGRYKGILSGLHRVCFNRSWNYTERTVTSSLATLKSNLHFAQMYPICICIYIYMCSYKYFLALTREVRLD